MATASFIGTHTTMRRRYHGYRWRDLPPTTQLTLGCDCAARPVRRQLVGKRMARGLLQKPSPRVRARLECSRSRVSAAVARRRADGVAQQSASSRCAGAACA
jgi:hypothetical protein